jgi:putative ABC transport system permease protein
MRGQVIAIALVIGSGVGVLVMSLTAQEALRTTTEAYYDRYRIADVFAGLKRAPESIADELAAIPGVQTVETRIVETVILDVAGFEEPVVAVINSVPEGEQPRLNQLVLRSGRLVEARAPDEVVVNEPFAEAPGLNPGDTFAAILNG